LFSSFFAVESAQESTIKLKAKNERMRIVINKKSLLFKARGIGK
jgi:hypothetical protein